MGENLDLYIFNRKLRSNWNWIENQKKMELNQNLNGMSKNISEQINRLRILQ